MIQSLNSFKWGCLVALLFLFSSCSIEKIDFKGVDNIKFKKLVNRNLSISFDAALNNPNKQTIKIKPSTCDFYINGDRIGIAHLDETISILKNSDASVTVPITIEIQQGAIPKLIAGALMKTASVRVVGSLKGSMNGFTKRKKIDETREVSLKDLKLGSLLNL
ncbi:MAG: LEA type 2 family protein [Crocinitomicaceae bacterium]|nr:LEA type 2 family protein [Crocinitomicaceae bacterium]